MGRAFDFVKFYDSRTTRSRVNVHGSFDAIFILVFVLGALWGSFANVVIYRLPKNLSVVRPRSHCNACKKMIAWYDNIPLFSWFILRGKCRHCGARFSIRYVLVEWLMAILFGCVYLKVGWSYLLLEYLILVFGLVTVSFIDFDNMILPDEFTLGGIAVGLIGAALNPERHFLPALWGVILGGGFLWGIAVIYAAIRNREGMGGGDIKLLAWIGAVLGWTSIPFVIICASLVGSLVGLALVLKDRRGMNYAIPFGPYLSLAAILYLFFGRALSLAYIHMFIPSL